MSSSQEKKSYRLSYIGVILGILGIFLTIYIYQGTIREREPCFITDPVRTRILKSTEISGIPIRVIRTDGTEIKSDLSSLRFYLWNNGKESIRDNNVLQQIAIRLDDPYGRIIYPTTLKISRGVTGLRIVADPQEPERQLLVSFKILEKNDGVTGQIIYEGNPEARLLISGVIEGTEGFRSDEYFHSRTKRSGYLVLSALLAMVVTMLIASLRESLRWIKNTSRPFRKNRIRVIFIVVHGIALIVLSYAFYNRTMEAIQGLNQKVVANHTPQSILPE